ncbi:hypothetical protein BDV96DRAFT_243249 [Lophiotrema nucula]|uniref:Uncharacterized protein n=1 Tax=Lophiotrema nucula TaxID=690887 RepID=A0A6A5YRA5_9PLEO|nr:hypothetical protein BDV96DRAFT_243249 [Lophiotrema nucula]
MSSQSLVLYSAPPTTSTLTFRPSSSTSTTSLISRRLFTQQTGTAIATELLYRILLEILNRVFVSVQGFAAKRLDALQDYFEKRSLERATGAAAAAAKKASEEGGAELGIVDEVGKAAVASGFICPLTGRAMGVHGDADDMGWKGRRGPPEWVKRRWEAKSKPKLDEEQSAWTQITRQGLAGSDIWVASAGC